MTSRQEVESKFEFELEFLGKSQTKLAAIVINLTPNKRHEYPIKTTSCAVKALNFNYQLILSFINVSRIMEH